MREKNDLLDGSAIRKRLVKCYVSQKEYEEIKAAAFRSGNMSVSNYVRKTLLFAGGSRFEISFSLGDLRAMIAQLSQYNQRMRNIVAAYEYRTNLYQADIDNLIRLSNELNQMILEICQTILADRKSEKRKAERFLREEVRKLLAQMRAEEQNGDSHPGKRYK